MKLKYIISVAFLFMIVAGCVSEFNANLPDSDEDILVIEGDIIANSEVDIVLSKTFALSNDRVPDGYNDVKADISLTGSDGYRSEPAVYMGSGVHRLSVGDLKDDVEYSLEISHQSDRYVTTPQKPLTTPEIVDLNWHQPVENGDVSIRVSANGEGNDDNYYMWDYIEDWEFRSQFGVVDFYDPVTREITHYTNPPVYYCWRNRRGKEILVGSTESYVENNIKNQPLCSYVSTDERFNTLYSIRVNQLAISKSAYEYFSNRAKMSDEMGGLFTPQPSELRGNIYCTNDESKKTIGYINIAKNTTGKQLYIDTSEISKNRIPGCELYGQAQVRELMKNMLLTDLHDFYLQGYWPVFIDQRLDDGAGWTEPGCIDCTRRGGSKKKPDFWPNNHE